MSARRSLVVMPLLLVMLGMSGCRDQGNPLGFMGGGDTPRHSANPRTETDRVWAQLDSYLSRIPTDSPSAARLDLPNGMNAPPELLGEWRIEVQMLREIERAGFFKCLEARAANPKVEIRCGAGGSHAGPGQGYSGGLPNFEVINPEIGSGSAHPGNSPGDLYGCDKLGKVNPRGSWARDEVTTDQHLSRAEAEDKAALADEQTSQALDDKANQEHLLMIEHAQRSDQLAQESTQAHNGGENDRSTTLAASAGREGNLARAGLRGQQRLARAAGEYAGSAQDHRNEAAAERTEAGHGAKRSPGQATDLPGGKVPKAGAAPPRGGEENPRNSADPGKCAAVAKETWKRWSMASISNLEKAQGQRWSCNDPAKQGEQSGGACPNGGSKLGQQCSAGQANCFEKDSSRPKGNLGPAPKIPGNHGCLDPKAYC